VALQPETSARAEIRPLRTDPERRERPSACRSRAEIATRTEPMAGSRARDWCATAHGIMRLAVSTDRDRGRERESERGVAGLVRA
jgi:hypothetical protein